MRGGDGDGCDCIDSLLISVDDEMSLWDVMNK